MLGHQKMLQTINNLLLIIYVMSWDINLDVIIFIKIVMQRLHLILNQEVEVQLCLMRVFVHQIYRVIQILILIDIIFGKQNNTLNLHHVVSRRIVINLYQQLIMYMILILNIYLKMYHLNFMLIILQIQIPQTIYYIHGKALI